VDLAAAFWLVEPISQPAPVEDAGLQPDRNPVVPISTPTAQNGVSYDESIVGTRHPGLDVSSSPSSSIPVREVST
jgi:hypothetical protein